MSDGTLPRQSGERAIQSRNVDLLCPRVATGQESLIQRDRPRGVGSHQFYNLFRRPPEIADEGIAGVIGDKAARPEGALDHAVHWVLAPCSTTPGRVCAVLNIRAYNR